MLRFLLSLLFLYLSTFSGAKAADTVDIVEKNILKIESSLLKGDELFPYDGVIELAHTVIKTRASYSNNTIAQSFILLANIAYHKGESNKAFQFASDGLMLAGINLDLRLNLLLKITKGHYKKTQFVDVLEHAERAIKLAYGNTQTESRIIALSYKAMALSSLGQPQKAFDILNKIELLIQNNQFTQHIKVIEILADAYLYQRDYLTAIDLYNKVIKLRFDLDYSTNLGQTYLNLAKAYKHLNKFDDAYNSYWQCKEHAEKYQIPIFTALANLGLGQVLSVQGKSEQSYAVLLEASNTLSNEQLVGPYVDVLIELSISARNLNQLENSNKWLTTAQKITEDYELTVDQIKLYELLATMYYEQQLFKLSTIFQKKYIESYKRFNSGSAVFQRSKYTPDIDVINNRDLVMKLSDESDLGFNYAAKFKKQETVIFLLSILLIVFGCVACIWFVRRAKLKSHFEYMSMEANQQNIASPSYTKQLYLFTFKMARKYNYPLTIAYIVVENWSELEFHFDKKTVREVDKTLSALLQECISEFDHAGKINDGEYILMCPHQSNDVILKDLEKLADALKVRFFANIGDFSIKIKYSCDMPVVQDIDPYLFLSRLSENHLTSIQKK